MAAGRFQKILEPGYIGTVRTRNRILKTGASPGSLPSENGEVPEMCKDYYEALARGGAGIVTVAGGSVQYPIPVTPMPRFRVDDDKFIPSLKELADVIKKHDCPAFLQLMNSSPMRRLLPPGSISISSSALTKDELPVGEFSPTRALSIEEIQLMVKLFADIAERAHKAGFHGVEINGGCNHFLNSFLSRFWNRRDDAYGAGSLVSRAKIYTDLIKEIKLRNGKDFAVIALFNGAEPRLKNGITSEESQQLAKLFQAAGADAIHIRVEFYKSFLDSNLRDSTHFPDIAMYPEIPHPLGADIDTRLHGPGGWIPLAAAVKGAVTIPVIGVGRLDAALGEKFIIEGKIDFVSLNRRLMADHEYPNKVAAGEMDNITPCTGCFTCFDSMERRGPALCQVNASLCKEKEFEIKPATKKKKVMIIGSGPAGMEAARVAASRGHQVLLYEKESKLGGSAPLAQMVKGFERENLISFIDYLKRQMVKLGVEVKTDTVVDKAFVKEVNPDVVLIATGGTHNIPKIPGIDSSKVVNGKSLHQQLKRYLKYFSPRTLRWLTNFYMPVGKNVVVIGGGLHGCQTAALLVNRGRKVTILEQGDSIGDGLLIIMVKPLIINWLLEKGTSMLTGVKYERITDQGITISTKDGKQQTIVADTIVTALPMLPNVELEKSLKGIVPEVYSIGDCREPQLIVNAVADGSRIAHLI
jgi:2,4-dienoyl-CoA reductase (NADPH2)